MQSSSLKHPPNDKLAILRKWQVDFCDGDHCAAMLMNHFDYWHTWKLEQSQKAMKANDIAEAYGDGRYQDESLYQFYTLDELSDVLLGLFGRTKIHAAIKILEEKKLITKHANPNPRYTFDKTVYYLFHPEVVNDFPSNQNKAIEVQKRTLDSSDLNDRESEFERSSSENELPSSRNGRYISNKITTEITSKTAAAKEEASPPDLTPNPEVPYTPAAASEIFIGKKLTANQGMILRNSIKKLPKDLRPGSDELILSIEAELLDEKSFTQAGNEFLKKLNTILRLLKAGRWQAPARLYEEAPSKASTRETEKQKAQGVLKEKLQAAKAAKKHWEGLKGYAERSGNPAALQYEKFIEEHAREIEVILAEMREDETVSAFLPEIEQHYKEA